METKTKIAGGAGSQNVSARWPDYAFTMLICFSSWQDQIACGELWSYFSKDPRSFRGLDQLLFAIENAVDEAGLPLGSSPGKFLKGKIPSLPRRRALTMSPRPWRASEALIIPPLSASIIVSTPAFKASLLSASRLAKSGSAAL